MSTRSAFRLRFHVSSIVNNFYRSQVTKPQDVNSELIWAIQTKDLSATKEALINGADPNFIRKGISVLYSAVWSGKFDIVELLLEQGAKPTPHPDPEDETLEYAPLTCAMRFGYIDIFKLLLQNEAPLSPNRPTGSSIWQAVYYQQPEMLEYLLSLGARPTYQCYLNQNPLYLAVILNNPVIVNILISYDAHPDFIDLGGCPMLCELALQGNLEAVRTLLSLEANPNVTDGEGWTALHYAAKQQNTAMMNLLLENKADPNLENLQGYTPPRRHGSEAERLSESTSPR